ncbi:MAG: hydroxymethylbilane synthase [Bradymonadaceae bacterium]|nr:hydroxymethylbilane synthase [Lujinxingiaceae bacterium]
MKLRIGSRKSRLALWQTRHVAALLKQHHGGLEIEIVTMDTMGDKISDVPLPQIGVKGLFTQELEDQLLAKTIDLAVHSLKDLPSTFADGLKFAGAPLRANPTDAFISTRWSSLAMLPQHAVLATGSQRRKSQLLSQLPGLRFESLRGNIDTRLRKLDEHGWDGIIMATAALERLGRMHLVSEELDASIYVPAVAQGAIGVEICEGRADIEALLAPIFDPTTNRAVEAERTFLRKLEGGCSVALGAYCHEADGLWTFHGWIGSRDGSQVKKERAQGTDPGALAAAMADAFIANGARTILES